MNFHKPKQIKLENENIALYQISGQDLGIFRF